jgi:hypothetical protein
MKNNRETTRPKNQSDFHKSPLSLAIYAPYRRFCVVIAKRRLVEPGVWRADQDTATNHQPAVALFQHPPLISFTDLSRFYAKMRARMRIFTT